MIDQNRIDFWNKRHLCKIPKGGTIDHPFEKGIDIF